MKLGKSLLLGSAAAFAATVGAQAADLPVRKAAPVDYVRVCDWTGVGYFYIPGTDTCIQLGGYLRAEYAFINNGRAFFPTAPTTTSTVGGPTSAATVGAGTIIPGRLRDQSGFKADGRLQADVRTQTAYGTLRTFVRFDLVKQGGNYQFGGTNGGQNSYTSQNGGAANLDKGYIQFAGITAGRVQSFFDFFADNYNYEGIANSDQSTQVIAYTYTGTGGFSATLALEDPTVRRQTGIGQIFTGTTVGPDRGVTGTVGYGGTEIPDIVGNIRVDQAWGAAQLSAAYHEVNTVNVVGDGSFTNSQQDGFAVQGGVQLKLPMLAAGDDLWLEGAYQEGAYLYQDSGSSFNGGFNSLDLGGFQHIDHDAIAIHTPGGPAGSYSLEKGTGFSAMAAINHYFSPNFHDVLFGSYEEISYGRAKNVDWTLGGLGDASEYRIGNQFLFDPVKNLEIGLEFDYAHLDQTLAHNPGQAASQVPQGVSINPDSFEARLRVERDF